jgi:MFS family permease
MNPSQKRPRVFYGWYIVTATLAIISYTGGIVSFGFTAVFEPIANEFHWSYAQVSLASSLRGLNVGLLAPLMGFLVDRFGPRRLVFVGSIIIWLGFITLSKTSSLAMFYAAFVLIATGMSTCTGTVPVATVNNWFRRRAGLATGIVASGFGLGGLFVPVVTGLIDAFEWRDAMVIVGFGMLVIVLPLSLVLRHRPEQYGYLPDGDVTGPVEVGETLPSKASLEFSISARRAITSRSFWHIAAAASCHSFVISAVVTHLMPYLSSVDITRSVSAIVALLLPLVSISGRLGSGWLADRVGSKLVFAASFISMTVGLFLFASITAGRSWLLVPFIIAFSLGWGSSVTSRFSFLREYYGRNSYGTILGFASGVMMVGNIIGAPLAGWVYDTWDSYHGAWLGFGALTLLGAVLVMTIPASEHELSTE